MEDGDSEYKRFLTEGDGETVVESFSEGMIVFPAGSEEQIDSNIKQLKEIAACGYFDEIQSLGSSLPGGRPHILKYAQNCTRGTYFN